MQGKIRICFLVPYPSGIAPGQRFRFEQYLSILTESGASVAFFPFLSEKVNRVLYKRGFIVQKILGVMAGFVRRLVELREVAKSDFVFIYREAAPIGPPVIEWFIAIVLGKKIIYDFDDAVWLPDAENESLPKKMIKWRSKVSSICRWSYKVSCGNLFLCNFASQYNKNVVLIPTTIDTENLHNPALYHASKDLRVITVGWTGTHSTLKYLSMLNPVIESLEKIFPEMIFQIIADKPPDLLLSSMRFVEWSEKTEIEDLLKIDVGVMPLVDDDWSKGKCGFKALQYMALEIPAVISAVGVNTMIVTQGASGFLCATEEEWKVALERLILDIPLRKKIGAAGRRVVMNSYSVNSVTPSFLGLFDLPRSS